MPYHFNMIYIYFNNFTKILNIHFKKGLIILSNIKHIIYIIFSKNIKSFIYKT